MRLKQIRLKSGMSQREFADKMGVTQPTVTRWEKGQAEMSGQRLRDAAELLECSPDEILGIRRGQPSFIDLNEDWDRDAACWGALRFEVAETAFEYPINFTQRTKLANAAAAYDQDSSWIEVLTLNNTILLINLAQLDGIDLVTDDQEQAPTHMSAEAYRALREAPSMAAEHLRQEIQSFQELHSDDEQTEITSYIRVHYASGRQTKAFLDQTTADAMSLLMFSLGDPSFYELPGQEGNLSHIISLGRVSMIAIPLAEFTRLNEELIDA